MHSWKCSVRNCCQCHGWGIFQKFRTCSELFLNPPPIHYIRVLYQASVLGVSNLAVEVFCAMYYSKQTGDSNFFYFLLKCCVTTSTWHRNERTLVRYIIHGSVDSHRLIMPGTYHFLSTTPLYGVKQLARTCAFNSVRRCHVSSPTIRRPPVRHCPIFSFCTKLLTEPVLQFFSELVIAWVSIATGGE